MSKNIYKSGQYNKNLHKSPAGHHNEENYLMYSIFAKNILFKNINIKNKKIFEFGCGFGTNINLLKNAVGYEIDPISIKFSRSKGINVFTKKNEIPLKSYDIVLINHVLEHVDNPLQTLKYLNSLLKPNGKLIVCLPYEPQMKINFNPDLNQHLYTWNFQTITNLLDHAGFKVILQDRNYARGFNLSKPLLKISESIFVFSLQLIGKLIPGNYGSFRIVAILKK